MIGKKLFHVLARASQGRCIDHDVWCHTPSSMSRCVIALWLSSLSHRLCRLYPQGPRPIRVARAEHRPHGPCVDVEGHGGQWSGTAPFPGTCVPGPVHARSLGQPLPRGQAACITTRKHGRMAAKVTATPAAEILLQQASMEASGMPRQPLRGWPTFFHPTCSGSGRSVHLTPQCKVKRVLCRAGPRMGRVMSTLR
jgi:hypothetical protein